MITKLSLLDKSIKSYTVRKLTPKECFRLMGVRDDVIDTMRSSVGEAEVRVGNIANRVRSLKDKSALAVSESQQYKQAGNSIVVDVLAHIYEQLWYPNGELRDTENEKKQILTTFSGYDSQCMAADVLKEKHPDFDWECVGWSDIDKYACLMHDIVFPEYKDKALGDITKIDWNAVKESLNGKDIDLFTYSSPCQDISQAGKQMGVSEGSGTRSALLWYVADAIEALKPKYLLQENVKALVSKKFMPDFQKWLDKLDELGYVSVWSVLNSKDYGVPQSRDRVFCLSMRKDAVFDYKFPEKIELTTGVKDILEDDVRDKYFLKDDQVYKYMATGDTDSAVFVKFDIPHTHESAMFLKTYLTEKVKDEWERKPTELKEYVESLKEEFYAEHGKFLENGIDAFDNEFKEKYSINIRK